MTAAPVLVADFDNTITDGDTISILVDAAITAQARAADVAAEEVDSRVNTLKQVKQRLTEEYGTAYKDLTDRYLPAQPPKKDLGLDMEVASGFLEELNDFEQRMNAKVIESNILHGLQESDVEAAAKSVELRPLAVTTLKRALASGWEVHVLSVNWSAHFIRAVLGAVPSRIVTDQDSEVPDGEVAGSVVHIHANHLEMQLGISTGGIVCRVQGPMDKANTLEDILLSRAAASGDGSSPCIYIGDSLGDMGALLAASSPIVLGENATLKHGIKVFACVLQPITSTCLEDSESQPPGHMLAAGDWHAIHEFLFPGVDAALEPVLEGAASLVVPPVATDASGVAASPAPAGPLPAITSVSASVSDSQVPTVLVIAGSDSGGGAGIQADIKACMANGAYACTAITALTSQNTHGVDGVHVPPLEVLQQQMHAVLGDIGARVFKTGMLPTAEAVAAVADAVKGARGTDSGVQLVVDPVMVATSGDALGDSVVKDAMLRHLVPLATVLTPNLHEAALLLGREPIHTVNDMREAAQALAALGPQAVLLKGGHLSSTNAERCLTDVLCTARGCLELPVPRMQTRNTHGTGCTLASSIAAHLARGMEIVDAVKCAQRYVHLCLSESVSLRLGGGKQGPMDHGAGVARPRVLHSARVDYSLYAVTDSTLNAKHGRSMAEAVAAAAAGGASMIQIREKDIDGGDFLAAVRAALKAVEQFEVAVIVNDRVDVALAAGAHGVHIGQSDLPCSEVRRLVGSRMLVGVSAKTVEQALAAQRDGADYIGVGAVFPTTTKDSPVMGVSGLRAIVEASEIPAVGIGGVTASNVVEVMSSGCSGVAVVSDIFGSEDVTASTRALLEAVKAARLQPV